MKKMLEFKKGRPRFPAGREGLGVVFVIKMISIPPQLPREVQNLMRKMWSLCPAREIWRG